MRSKDQVFLAIASTLSELGTCDRAQVGAVITLNGRCVSWGFNGAPPGLPHCSENYHGWITNGCHPDEVPEEYQAQLYEQLHQHGCRNATHAEANTLAFAARQGISTDGGTLYVTVSPCDTCARLLIAAGIQRVVAAQPYRDDSGLRLLSQAELQLNVEGKIWSGPDR